MLVVTVAEQFFHSRGVVSYLIIFYFLFITGERRRLSEVEKGR
jgi:hypothetical protein